MLIPVIPPMLLQAPNLELTAKDVAATIMQVIITMVECPREKNVPTVTGRWPDAIKGRVIRSNASSSVHSRFTMSGSQAVPQYGPYPVRDANQECEEVRL